MTAPMNVKTRVLSDLRNALDFLLTDCYRYMKRHKAEFWKSFCVSCNLRLPDGGVHDQPCGACFNEEQRIIGCLRGFGMSNRYHKKESFNKYLRNKYGRIIYYKQRSVKGRLFHATKL